MDANPNAGPASINITILVVLDTTRGQLQDVFAPIKFSQAVLDIHCKVNSGMDMNKCDCKRVSLCQDLIAVISLDAFSYNLHKLKTITKQDLEQNLVFLLS